MPSRGDFLLLSAAAWVPGCFGLALAADALIGSGWGPAVMGAGTVILSLVAFMFALYYVKAP